MRPTLWGKRWLHDLESHATHKQKIQKYNYFASSLLKRRSSSAAWEEDNVRESLPGLSLDGFHSIGTASCSSKAPDKQINKLSLKLVQGITQD